MKTALSFVILAAVLPCRAEIASAAPMRDAVKHEDLVQEIRKNAAQQAAAKPQGETLLPGTPDPAVANPPPNILEMVDIFCFNGFACPVPKRAILRLPDAYASRVGSQPGARFVAWGKFLLDNRGWITTQEVSRAQAEGKEPLPDDVQKALATSTRIVVATYGGDPISVLTPKPEEPGKPASTPATGKPAATTTATGKPQ